MRAPDGQWVVLIPVEDVNFTSDGGGTYVVRKKDGSESEVMVRHVSKSTRRIRGREYVCGIPERAYNERASRVPALSHVPPDPFQPRLSKRRDQVIAPLSVLDRAARKGEPLEIDGTHVWVEDSDWRPWTHDGVRMGRAPVAAARAV